MTIEQMRDQIAAADGWTSDLAAFWTKAGHRDIQHHPMSTLDGLASAWARMAPEWDINLWKDGAFWICDADAGHGSVFIGASQGPDELTARTACLHAVLVKKGVIK